MKLFSKVACTRTNKQKNNPNQKTKQNSNNNKKRVSSHVAQQVKDLALLHLWPRLQLWHRFDPWPRNFHILWVWQKKKKKSGLYHFTLLLAIFEGSSFSTVLPTFGILFFFLPPFLPSFFHFPFLSFLSFPLSFFLSFPPSFLPSLNFSHPSSYELVSPCGFHLHFMNN